MYKSIIIYGFSIFCMFFGSGNLVFPLQIGVNVGPNHWLIGLIGLLITGVALPFLGLFVIKLYKGSYEDFFGTIGGVTRWLLPLLLLSIIGSFGVMPRCITVAYGGIEYILPNISLPVFSLICSVICFVICLNDSFMVTLLGKWLTPILLARLAYLIIYGVIKAPILGGSEVSTAYNSFFVGFFQGYETMDLLASFFFSSVVFKQLQNLFSQVKNHHALTRIAIRSSLVGAILLGTIYAGFIFLGAYYKDVVMGLAPELILPTIAMHVIGVNASYLISIIVFLSCITTAVAVNNIYARYICTFLKLPDNYFKYVLATTTAIAFFVSLLDFKGITGFLAPILDILYPALIGLVFLSLIPIVNKHFKIVTFYSILLLTAWVKY